MSTKFSSFDAIYPVVLGNAFIEEGVIGIDHITGGTVIGKKIGKEKAGFFDHGVYQPPVTGIFRVQVPVRIGIINLIQLEPGIEEFLHKAFRFRLAQ